MDGADLPFPSPSAAAATGERRPEIAGDGTGAEDERAASPPELCEATLPPTRSLLLVLLSSELDRLLENAPSLLIMQHSARISTIRKRISALNMLLKSIQGRIDNIDRIVSTGLTNDHSSSVQSQSLK